jgi:hypothetical protein
MAYEIRAWSAPSPGHSETATPPAAASSDGLELSHRQLMPLQQSNSVVRHEKRPRPHVRQSCSFRYPSPAICISARRSSPHRSAGAPDRGRQQSPPARTGTAAGRPNPAWPCPPATGRRSQSAAFPRQVQPPRVATRQKPATSMGRTAARRFRQQLLAGRHFPAAQFFHGRSGSESRGIRTSGPLS